MNSSTLLDSNLYAIVDTAIATFHANMEKLKGTKPDTVLLETQASELFMLIQVTSKQMPLQIVRQFEIGTEKYRTAITELDNLAEKMSNAIDPYQQEQLSIIRNNFTDPNRHLNRI